LSAFDDELTPDPAETWWDYFQETRDLPMEPQQRDWTCSVCATDWLLRATGLDPYSDRVKVGHAMGYPNCVDEWSGLKDTQCIVRVLESFGVKAQQEWVSWDRALELAGSTAYILNSTSWYHFVGGRGLDGPGLWVANSSPGYQGINEHVDESDWYRLPGWQMVYLVH
jgi:hypothetical protein